MRKYASWRGRDPVAKENEYAREEMTEVDSCRGLSKAD